MTNAVAGREVAILGGGCFWCLEAVFQQIDGVASVVSGYIGGHTEAPDYHSVCEGTTGHAEVVALRFDPARVSYATLLEVFFAIHDPTTPNRQGNDVGSQYRSAIFATTPAQLDEARVCVARLTAEGIFPAPIVTELQMAPRFWPAEDYHQDYFRQNGERQPYCLFVVAPKVAKFRARFAALLGQG